jgi:ferritin
MENNILKRTLKVSTVTSEPLKTSINKAPILSKNPLIDESCISFLNYRIQQEEYSSRIYLAMSMWLNNNGFMNAAKVWKKYSDEEINHANIAREYLLNMGVQPATPPLEQPTEHFKGGFPEIIRKSHQHEIDITMQCSDLANHALKDGSHMLYELALHYLREQNEEMGKTQDLVDQLETFGEDKIALRLFDHELGEQL